MSIIGDAPVPIKSLVAFQRVSLDADGSATLDFEVSAKQLAIVDDEGTWQVSFMLQTCCGVLHRPYMRIFASVCRSHLELTR